MVMGAELLSDRQFYGRLTLLQPEKQQENSDKNLLKMTLLQSIEIKTRQTAQIRPGGGNGVAAV